MLSISLTITRPEDAVQARAVLDAYVAPGATPAAQPEPTAEKDPLDIPEFMDRRTNKEEPAEPKPEAPTFTPAQVRDALTAFAKTQGPEAFANLLQQHGAKRLTEVKEAAYPAIMSAIEAAA